jgi:hypothetical protein
MGHRLRSRTLRAETSLLRQSVRQVWTPELGGRADLLCPARLGRLLTEADIVSSGYTNPVRLCRLAPRPPKNQTQMTTIAATIDDYVCTLIDLMERIYISNFLDA